MNDFFVFVLRRLIELYELSEKLRKELKSRRSQGDRWRKAYRALASSIRHKNGKMKRTFTYEEEELIDRLLSEHEAEELAKEGEDG